MPAVASTNPPVLIAMFAAATEHDADRVRRGDAAQPRAAGRRRAVRPAGGGYPGPHRPRYRSGTGQRSGDQLGAAPRRPGDRGSRAVPRARHEPDRDAGARRRRAESAGEDLRRCGPRRRPSARPAVWLLGSRDYSARLAATLGLPYVFAHHFSGSGTAEALELYRTTFRPSGFGARASDVPHRRTSRSPRRARRRSRSPGRNSWRWSPSAPAVELGPQPSVEEALARPWRPSTRHSRTRCCRAGSLTSRPRRRSEFGQLAAQFGVDEVMVHPVAGASADDPPDRSRPANGPSSCWPITSADRPGYTPSVTSPESGLKRQRHAG